MYYPRKISTTHFTLSNEIIGAVYNIERDVQRCDARIRHSPYANAIRKTLVRGDGLGVLNIKRSFPDIYTIMRVEVAASIVNKHEDTNRILRNMLNAEEHPTLPDAIEVFRFMQTTEWVTNPDNKNCMKTPQDLLRIYTFCDEGTQESSIDASFRQTVFENSNNSSPSNYEAPSPEALPGLISDFCSFINADTLSPISQASIAQFQFEALKPFGQELDRMERLCIDYIFCRRKLLQSIILPLNFFAAHTQKDFYGYLAPYLNEAPNGTDNSLPYIEKLIMHSVESAYELIQLMVSLHKLFIGLVQQWTARLGHVEKRSAVESLLYLLTGTPIMTISQASNYINRSFSTTSSAFERLVNAGILKEGKSLRRHKTYEATEAIYLHDSLYRRYLPDTSKLRDLKITQPR